MEPAAPRLLLHAGNLQPGGGMVSGEFTLTNQTGERLSIAPRLRPSGHSLDQALMVRLRSGNNEIARGHLGSLRRGPGSLQLAPGDSTNVELDAWLPDSAGSGWQAALVEVAVVLESKRAAR
ncbi:MAG: hypothetical protein EXQ70_08500 [Solirubrobacterales bacterium]|nr:hypothetical protein [Solirubrobacterales bacterium]